MHHLLARRPVNILRPFLQKTYFSLKVISQAPLSKALDKVAFLQSKGVVGYNKKKKCKKAKWLSEEALQIAVKRREAKGREKERYAHLNAEF